MKKLPALAGTLLVTALCLSACTPVESNESHSTAPITLGPDSLPSQHPEPGDKDTSEAALNLQLFFTAVDDETDALTVDVESLDREQVKASYSQAMKSIDVNVVSKDDADRLIRDYAKNIDTIPNKGYVGITPKELHASVDGSVTVRGEDLFIVYKEDSKYVTRKGASMTSDETLNDVFTMSKVDGSWKITKIVL